MEDGAWRGDEGRMEGQRVGSGSGSCGGRNCGQGHGNTFVLKTIYRRQGKAQDGQRNWGQGQRQDFG